MDTIAAGVNDSLQSVTAQTNSKHDRAFKFFQAHLHKCQILGDPFLDNFLPNQRTLILTSFAYCIRQNHYGCTTRNFLLGKTVGSTISDLVQAFRANLRPDPTRDATGEKAAILTRQIKAYKNSNPPPNHQAALPLIVWNAINNNHNTIKDSAIGSLIIGALFFAMRSCKYSHTDKNESKKTKLLCLRNIQFFNKSTDGYLQEVPHDSNLTTLQSSDCITITFENQKNGQKDATITQHKTPANRICPVKAWANTIHRILSYEGTDSNTEVNTFKINGKLVKFTSKQICQHIKSTVKTIGSSRLGIDIKRVGTHSLRTSAAMLLYLANVRTSTIMLLGRWHSDAFLLYL